MSTIEEIVARASGSSKPRPSYVSKALSRHERLARSFGVLPITKMQSAPAAPVRKHEPRFSDAQIAAAHERQRVQKQHADEARIRAEEAQIVALQKSTAETALATVKAEQARASVRVLEALFDGDTASEVVTASVSPSTDEAQAYLAQKSLAALGELLTPEIAAEVADCGWSIARQSAGEAVLQADTHGAVGALGVDVLEAIDTMTRWDVAKMDGTYCYLHLKQEASQ